MKCNGIEYKIEGTNIIFPYMDGNIIIPISMGQSARYLINNYMDKVNRGTINALPKTTFPHNNLVLEHMELLIADAYKKYRFNFGWIRAFETDLLRKISDDVKEELEIIIPLLRNVQPNTSPSVFTEVRAILGPSYDRISKYRKQPDSKYIIVDPLSMEKWGNRKEVAAYQKEEYTKIKELSEATKTETYKCKKALRKNNNDYVQAKLYLEELNNAIQI